MTVTDKIEVKRTPAYAPYESFNRLLDRMKECLPLPSPLDSSFWIRMRFSGSITSALKSTLIYLGLLSQENMPTEELENLIKTAPEMRSALLSKIIDRAYESILTKLDLERATTGQLRAEFKALGADGQVGQKAMSFFLALAKDANKKMHPHLTARQPRGSRKTIIRTKEEQEDTRVHKPPPPGDIEGTPILQNVHPAIAGLLKVLPSIDEGWTDDERKRFKIAFEALLDVVYPLKT